MVPPRARLDFVYGRWFSARAADLPTGIGASHPGKLSSRPRGVVDASGQSVDPCSRYLARCVGRLAMAFLAVVDRQKADVKHHLADYVRRVVIG